MNSIRASLCAVACSLMATTAAVAATAADLERLNEYAELIGRAQACGADTTEAMRAVGRWMDTTFRRASRTQHSYVVMFASNLRQHAREQSESAGAGSCTPVLRAFHGFSWSRLGSAE
jgi:hypothetical protein